MSLVLLSPGASSACQAPRRSRRGPPSWPLAWGQRASFRRESNFRGGSL